MLINIELNKPKTQKFYESKELLERFVPKTFYVMKTILSYNIVGYSSLWITFGVDSTDFLWLFVSQFKANSPISDLPAQFILLKPR